VSHFFVNGCNKIKPIITELLAEEYEKSNIDMINTNEQYRKKYLKYKEKYIMLKKNIK